MSKSIGIDLGTTNSAAAIKRVHTEVLKNAEGDFITPSCVTLRRKKRFLGNSSFVVGKHALEWLKQNPENTIVSVKRLMGRNYQDSEVQRIIAGNKLHYKIARHSKGTENSLSVILDKKEYTPEEISSKILGKIRIDCERELDGTIEYAVITVPAYFNDKQKHATKTAAALAGLKVQRLLPEPTAAAISFGVDNVKGDEAKTALIYDFGGGTFDISVLTISGGQFIEQGKGGDMWLGGDDIDHLISDFVLTETEREYNIKSIQDVIGLQPEERKNRFLGELKAKVEKAKIQLSTESEVVIELLGLLKDQDGDAIDIQVTLTRQQFNTFIEPLIERTVLLIHQLLNDMNFTKDLIDSVLLVGGCSLIPLVVDTLKKEFGDEKVLVHKKPMLAIAEGAAILSHRLADTYECPQCAKTVSQSDTVCPGCNFDLEKYMIDSGMLEIVHSAAHDYYIYLENNEKYLFVEKHIPLPVEKTEVFKLVHPDQKLVHMKFFNIVNDRQESIGDLWLGILGKEEYDKESEVETKTKEISSVEITLKIDESNLIEVTAALREHPDIKLSKTLSRGQADEKLFLSLEKAINDANLKKYSRWIVLDILHRSLSIIQDINKVVDPETGKVNKTLYARASLKIEKCEKMAVADKCTKPVINYGHSLLDMFGDIIPPRDKKSITSKIKRLEEVDEQGTYENTVRALEDLHDTYDNLGIINNLMEIANAGSICAERDPSKSSKFAKYMSDIMAGIGEAKKDKVTSLLDEILPETHNIINQYASESEFIYKSITK